MAQARPRITLSRRRIIIALLIVVLVILIIAQVFSITGIFNTIVLGPMLNFLILMSRYLGSFGLAIIVMTIVIRILVFPLTLRQLRSSKAMRKMQPQIKELQKQFSDDKQRLGQEITKLYGEVGFNPLGCFFSNIVQYPIWIALYLSVIMALAYTPENLVGLSDRLYSPSILQNSLPLSQHFLGLNLTQGNIVLAFLEGLTIWMLSRMSTMQSPEPQQQFMNRLMVWGISLVFAWLAFVLPSGLALYWVTSNIVGMVLQYPVTGWGSLKRPSLAFLKGGIPHPVGNPRAKRSTTISIPKRAGQGVTKKQVGAKTGSARSEKKDATRDDARSPKNETGYKELEDKPKDL